jgi:pterin 4 alpha carbinolamine dehydratase
MSRPGSPLRPARVAPLNGIVRLTAQPRAAISAVQSRTAAPTRVPRPLRDAVARAEREMSHHARVEQQEGTVTFEVWTHPLDRVTDRDVELARRIDEAVDAVGAAG